MIHPCTMRMAHGACFGRSWSREWQTERGCPIARQPLPRPRHHKSPLSLPIHGQYFHKHVNPQLNVCLYLRCMETLRVDILNPKAKQLLFDLMDMNLIRVSDLSSPRKKFLDLLEQMRSKDAPSPEDIQKEVKAVRKRLGRGR